MLSKDVCKQCSEKNWPKVWRNNDDLVAWGPDDIAAWERGDVVCPIKYGRDGWPHAEVKSAPPSYCLCKFEHAVAAGVQK